MSFNAIIKWVGVIGAAIISELVLESLVKGEVNEQLELLETKNNKKD